MMKIFNSSNREGLEVDVESLRDDWLILKKQNSLWKDNEYKNQETVYFTDKRIGKTYIVKNCNSEDVYKIQLPDVQGEIPVNIDELFLFLNNLVYKETLVPLVKKF